MIDSDLAELYEVETKALNQAVTRNPSRFPKQFCFRVTREEDRVLRSQIVTSKRLDIKPNRAFTNAIDYSQ